MENSFLFQELTEIKKCILEAYIESKKNIETETSLITQKILKIKKEQEIFYQRTIEILSKSENDPFDYKVIHTQSRDEISQPQRTKSKSPGTIISNKLINQKELRIKSKLDYFNPLKKRTNLNESKKNNISSHNKSTHKQIENIIRTKMKKTKTNTTTISQLKKQNKGKIGGDLIYCSAMSTNCINSNTSNSSGSINNMNGYKDTAKRSNTINLQTNLSNSQIINKVIPDNTLQRVDARKLTNTEIRKFSIIDIPCLPTQENKIKENNDSLTFTESNNRNKGSLFYIENKDYINKLDNNKEKLYFLLARSEVMPIQYRLFFSKINSKVYQIYNPGDVIKNYVSFLEKKIKKLKDKYSSFKKFHPSLTAQTTMKFILSNEENNFYSILDNNNETVILNLLKLIMIIINNDKKQKIKFNNDDTKKQITQIKEYIKEIVKESFLSKYYYFI